MQKLLPLCLKHYQLSAEELSKGLSKETEELRYNVSVVLDDIIGILEKSKVLSIFSTHLSQILSTSTVVSDYEKYSQLEAIAGCIISIAETSIDSQELYDVFSLLCRETWPVIQVNNTICKIFASNSSKLPNETLVIVINYLVNCLKAQVPAKSVASAVKNICILNPTELLNHLNALLSLHQISLSLPENAQELILEGIASVI